MIIIKIIIIVYINHGSMLYLFRRFYRRYVEKLFDIDGNNKKIENYEDYTYSLHKLWINVVYV